MNSATGGILCSYLKLPWCIPSKHDEGQAAGGHDKVKCYIIRS
ncbi:UNVERIFIED_ORG: hypothetical protein QOE_4071 [Clostridioides difficile F501]